MVVDAVQCEAVSGHKPPITGKNTGKIAKMTPDRSHQIAFSAAITGQFARQAAKGKQGNVVA